MLKHPVVNTDNVRIVNRVNRQALEWGHNSINLINLKSFKRGETDESKNSIILNFPYSEVELPCNNHSVMLKVMDDLQIYLDRVNTVDVPEVKESKEKVIPPTILPNQVIKLANKKQIPLIGLKDISCEGVQISLYYEQVVDPKIFKAENPTEAILIIEKAQEHLKKMQLLEIFKNLQSNNPFASPVDLWKKAEETRELLVKQEVNPFY